MQKSKHVRDLKYDEERQELQITFHNQAVYRYPKVPREVYQQVLNAPSLGEAFHALVRNQYQGKKVG